MGIIVTARLHVSYAILHSIIQSFGEDLVIILKSSPSILMRNAVVTSQEDAFGEFEFFLMREWFDSVTTAAWPQIRSLKGSSCQ